MKSIIKSYDNFFLPASNLNVAKEFYTDKLGLEIKFDFSDKGMVAFFVGDSEPAVILRAAEKTASCIWFEVENVPEAYQELKNKGIVFLSEPYKIMTGLAAEFKDPDGNTFGITDYSEKRALL